MKKLLFLLCLSFACVGSNAQTSDFTAGSNPFYTPLDTVKTLVGVGATSLYSGGVLYNVADQFTINGGLHPAICTVTGLRVSTSGTGLTVTTVIGGSGAVTSISGMPNHGSGYAVGDFVKIVGGGNNAYMQITVVGVGGSVTAALVIINGTGYSAGTATTTSTMTVSTYTLTEPGYGYTIGTIRPTTAITGSGKGLRVNILTLDSYGNSPDTMYAPVNPYRNSVGFQINYTGVADTGTAVVTIQGSLQPGIGGQFTTIGTYAVHFNSTTQSLYLNANQQGNQFANYRLIFNVPVNNVRCSMQAYVLLR